MGGPFFGLAGSHVVNDFVLDCRGILSAVAIQRCYQFAVVTTHAPLAYQGSDAPSLIGWDVSGKGSICLRCRHRI